MAVHKNSKSTYVPLQFPEKGLSRSSAYEGMTPGTTIRALNVRPDGTFKSRRRGGSRPGLKRAYNQVVGSSTSKVNMINEVRLTDQDANIVDNLSMNYLSLDATGNTPPDNPTNDTNLKWNDFQVDKNSLGNWSVWDSFEDYLTPGSATSYSIPLITDIDDYGLNTNIDETQPKYFNIDLAPHNGKIVGVVNIYLEPSYGYPVDTDQDQAQDSGWNFIFTFTDNGTTNTCTITFEANASNSLIYDTAQYVTDNSPSAGWNQATCRRGSGTRIGLKVSDATGDISVDALVDDTVVFNLSSLNNPPNFSP